MSWSWYAVKMLFRSEAKGKLKRADPEIDPDIALIEERVVLFRARTHKEAIRKAEKEAKEYEKISYENPYGQRIKVRYLGACDAFIIYDPLENGAEIYSRTEVIDKQKKDNELIDGLLGREESEKIKEKRMIFMYQSSIKR